MTLPEPYAIRYESGEVEYVELDGVAYFQTPGADVLYPGEVAEFQLKIDEEAGVVRYTIVVKPAPGVRARLTRWRYLAYRRLGGTR